MVSENTLLFPIIVTTLSGVLTVVPNSPTASTVPVTPPTVTKSPTLNGRRNTRNAPAAKFASSPPQATPMATPPAARSAANVVVSTPKSPRIATIKMAFRMTDRPLSQIPAQRRVESLTSKRSGQHPHGEPDEPSPGQPEEQSTGNFPRDGHQRGHRTCHESVRIHRSPPSPGNGRPQRQCAIRASQRPRARFLLSRNREAAGSTDY